MVSVVNLHWRCPLINVVYGWRNSYCSEVTLISILNFYEVECIKGEGEEDNCSIQMSPLQRLEMPTTLNMLIYSKEILLFTIIISITIFLQDKVKWFAALYQLCFDACITTYAICFSVECNFDVYRPKHLPWSFILSSFPVIINYVFWNKEETSLSLQLVWWFEV